MPNKKIVIQEKAVIAVGTSGNPIGEALKAGTPIPASPLTLPERSDMVERMENSISGLMDDAENTYQANCRPPRTTGVDQDYITRLSTNEFFFYTKEPLTLKEFEGLQNKIAEKAKTLSPGVQLILGSFAVKTDDNKVMNVTPHITCGKPPNFQLIVKNYTSPIDVRYKIPDGQGNADTLPVLDNKSKSSTPMPQITINGVAKDFSFNNIVMCKTPGGTPFVTAIDICLDHAFGVAKNNYNDLAKKNPDILSQPVSQVVVSNCIDVDKTQCIGPNLMHVDPGSSPQECKKGIAQQPGAFKKLPFGNDLVRVFDVARQQIKHTIENTYAYQTTAPTDGRDHGSYTASFANIKFHKSESENTATFENFKNKYQAYKGDYLKTQILEDLKNRIQKSSSKEELADLKKELKTSYEVDVLNTAQGWFTQKFGLKTSSIKSLENMIEQQEKILTNTSPKPSK